MKGFLEELRWRGLLNDLTPGLPERLAQGPIAGYVGFDTNAPSLQMGNMVPVMLLAHLQRAGGTPVVLVGAGTAMIGDPSGKSTERPLLAAAEIDANAERIRDQLGRFLDFSGSANDARMLNNAAWLRDLPLVEFLRDTGKHFTIAYLMQKESVKTRIESGLSFTEFSYMLLQAYDFLHLSREEGVELQMGGSDQWGNITAGIELIRRVDGRQVHALSAPLVTKSDGGKFGKSEEGAVWLDAERTSPYKLFQFWINADDRDVESYLKIFTFKSQDEIGGLMEDQREDPGARPAQRSLAADLTERIHGGDAARRAMEAAHVFFNKSSVDAVRGASPSVWETLEHELPTWSPSAEFELPVDLVSLAAASGLTASKGEARRQAQQGALYVNGERMSAERMIGEEHLLAGRYIWLRRGKKTDVIVKLARGS
jgi:tyrosyl-tRNA synthetase